MICTIPDLTSAEATVLARELEHALTAEGVPSPAFTAAEVAHKGREVGMNRRTAQKYVSASAAP